MAILLALYLSRFSPNALNKVAFRVLLVSAIAILFGAVFHALGVNFSFVHIELTSLTYM